MKSPYEGYLMREKKELCAAFYQELTRILAGEYESVGSNCGGGSTYLVPAGTDGEISWYGKPEESFRVSDHWNWYANLKKCSWENYIQCYSRDLPYAWKRTEPGKATRPIMADCVCLYRDGVYQVVYGEKYNRKTKTWTWVDCAPETAAEMVRKECAA